MKALKLDPKTAFDLAVAPPEEEVRRRGVSKILGKLAKDISQRIEDVKKLGLPLRYPFQPDHVKVVEGLFEERFMDSVEASGYRPDFMKSLVYSGFLFATALERYKGLTLGKHKIFDSLKIVIDFAERLQQQIRQIQVEGEQAFLSECAHQIESAPERGLRILPKSAHAIRLALGQAEATGMMKSRVDAFRWLEGYIKRRLAQESGRPDNGLIVIDVIKGLEEDIETYCGAKIWIRV
jgi:hypothetical protein